MKRDVAIIGAGYVGLPLARTFADAGKQVLLVDVDARSRRATERGESYIEDVPTEVLKPLVDAGLVTATTDYDELREADAILVALPTPLSRQREPDLRILVLGRRVDRNASPRGTSRRPRVDDVSGHDPRAGAADPRGGQRPHGRQGLPPRLLARARRSRSRGLDDEDRAKVVGGIDADSTAAAVELYSRRDRQRPPRLVARGSGAHEAPREHLPLGQHRARQRARAALRPDEHRRLGGHRRGRDEAVRVHAVQAGARVSAATASRSIRSTSRGRRASSTSTPSSSSSRGRSTRRCRTTVARWSRRLSTTPVSARSRARRSSSSASPTSRTSSDTRESPGDQADQPAPQRRRRRPYHDPHVPSFAENGVTMSSVGARPERLRLRRHRDEPLGHRLRAARRATPSSWSTSATRPAGTGRIGQGLEAVSIRVGQAGLGYWGKNLARNFDDLADLAWLCDPAEGKDAEFAEPLPARPLGRRLRRDARRPRARRGRDRDSGAVRTTSSRSGRSRPASTCSSRSRRR